jgi:uncharacterized membrane protein
VQYSIVVAAPQDRLWQVLTEVERWPELTASVTGVAVLNEMPLGAGAQVRIEQPRMHPLTWTVTRFEPGWTFVWESTAAGVRTVAGHRIEPRGTGSRLTLTVDQSGALAPLVRLLTGRRTASYVRMEALGLKNAAEG